MEIFLEEDERERQRLESRISELQGRNEELQATVEHLQQQKPIKVRLECFLTIQLSICM